jgi:hypothetical protein
MLVWSFKEDLHLHLESFAYLPALYRLEQIGYASFAFLVCGDNETSTSTKSKGPPQRRPTRRTNQSFVPQAYHPILKVLTLEHCVEGPEKSSRVRPFGRGAVTLEP